MKHFVQSVVAIHNSVGISNLPPADLPPEVRRTLAQEFFDFLKTFGIIGLAIAFVIGQAAGRLVTAFVNDITDPIIGLFLPAGSLETLSVKVTNLINSIIMDEPLASLDSSRRHTLMNMLTQDKSFSQIFLITHTEAEFGDCHSIMIDEDGNGRRQINYRPIKL